MDFNPQVWGDEDIQEGEKKNIGKTQQQENSLRYCGKMWFGMIGKGFTGQAWLRTLKSRFVRTTKLRLKSFI